MRTYEIVKFFEDNEFGSHPPKVIGKGYTLEEARKYCDDPECSSMTAKPPLGCGGDKRKIDEWHKKQKHWFIGFRSI